MLVSNVNYAEPTRALPGRRVSAEDREIFGLDQYYAGGQRGNMRYATASAPQDIFGVGLGQIASGDTARSLVTGAQAVALGGVAAWVFLSIEGDMKKPKNIALATMGGGLSAMAILALGQALGLVRL